uniref:F-box/kelch-repeat protein n=1 Tax=Noccaea caerulescens TaxID=107243 RepID=A0A1J3E434_NOCCA
MSSPERKREKTTTEKPLRKPSPLLPPTPQSTPKPSLPRDLLLSCFALISRLYYPTLSLVSKGFRSLLASPELYQIRSRLHRTESCLYVCLSLPPDPSPKWFTLCRRPNRTLTKEKKLSRNLLVPISSPPSTPFKPKFVAVGSDIYQLGGRINGVPSSKVSVLDCRSHSWRQAPNMHVARDDRTAIALDGQIYVSGDLSKGLYTPDLVEIYDPKTLTWKFVLPGSEESFSLDLVVIGLMAWRFSYCCVIDKVRYMYQKEEFYWLDVELKEFRILKGLKGLPKFDHLSSNVHLVDYGGNLAVLWDDHGPSGNSQEKMIWCAVIAIDRSNPQEITGTVEWFDAVLEVPKSYAIVGVLAATV